MKCSVCSGEPNLLGFVGILSGQTVCQKCRLEEERVFLTGLTIHWVNRGDIPEHLLAKYRELHDRMNRETGES